MKNTDGMEKYLYVVGEPIEIYKKTWWNSMCNWLSFSPVSRSPSYTKRSITEQDLLNSLEEKAQVFEAEKDALRYIQSVSKFYLALNGIEEVFLKSPALVKVRLSERNVIPGSTVRMWWVYLKQWTIPEASNPQYFTTRQRGSIGLDGIESRNSNETFEFPRALLEAIQAHLQKRSADISTPIASV